LAGGGGVGCPKTIILNEDLEEIGDSGLNFGRVYAPLLEEIRIPQSVKYIGERAFTAKKYIYITVPFATKGLFLRIWKLSI